MHCVPSMIASIYGNVSSQLGCKARRDQPDRALCAFAAGFRHRSRSASHARFSRRGSLLSKRISIRCAGERRAPASRGLLHPRLRVLRLRLSRGGIRRRHFPGSTLFDHPLGPDAEDSRFPGVGTQFFCARPSPTLIALRSPDSSARSDWVGLPNRKGLAPIR